jgi:hypothetical protein
MATALSDGPYQSKQQQEKEPTHSFFIWLSRLGRLLKIFSSWRARCARLAHRFATTAFDSFAFCGDVRIKARFHLSFSRRKKTAEAGVFLI